MSSATKAGKIGVDTDCPKCPTGRILGSKGRTKCYNCAYRTPLTKPTVITDKDLEYKRKLRQSMGLKS